MLSGTLPCVDCKYFTMGDVQLSMSNSMNHIILFFLFSRGFEKLLINMTFQNITFF